MDEIRMTRMTGADLIQWDDTSSEGHLEENPQGIP